MIKRNAAKPVRVAPPMMEEQEVSTTPLREWLDREETVSHLLFCKGKEEGIDKSYKSFKNCTFRNQTFSECKFRSSQLADIRFENCDLSNISFAESSLYRVEFIGCKLTGTNFSESIFNHTTIRDCKGDYVISSMSKLRNVSFNQCFLRGGGLDNCQFTNVEFEHCNLVEAELHRTSLKGIDLTSSEIAGIRIGSIPGGELKGATVTSLQALDIARMLGITIKD